ncbi:MAG: hypothetical protein IJU44_04450 [Kiritimatiellae bacterium]|nr:hypothetical protein [Kiritimatiellia bacterium]
MIGYPDAKGNEQKSAAVTLSDMEIFVFPELMYSLVLANIMAPSIWKWLDDPWFANFRRLKPYRRIQRLKQYIMDHYVFNLDLETWGLTRQQRELDRFSGFLPPEVIAKSNALFGYHGDSYYFDIDIRTHFGLDKYGPEVIPYWKTETVEAMDAFRFRDNFNTGAGECVSLAALYAAALFVVAGIPLEDVFLMATPLHSQNFVDWADGVLINNRRLVTKAMWFNGSQISGQARRALENEQVTIVSHPTGWIHTLYSDATISESAYLSFSAKLSEFLCSPLTPELLGNFLRQNSRCQECFVLRCGFGGHECYIPLEMAFRFESETPYFVTGQTRPLLLENIPREFFAASRPSDRLVLNDLETVLHTAPLDLSDPKAVAELAAYLQGATIPATEMAAATARFAVTRPNLPDVSAKRFVYLEKPLEIKDGMTREEIIAHLESIREGNLMADMAFYAWRDMSRTDYRPFLKAALERNPVCIEGAAKFSTDEIFVLLDGWSNESIYPEPFRLAQPDEVWNFRHGDGWEKAVTAATILRQRFSKSQFAVKLLNGFAALEMDGSELHRFRSAKNFTEMEWVF